jgi:hypothetical protein
MSLTEYNSQSCGEDGIDESYRMVASYRETMQQRCTQPSPPGGNIALMTTGTHFAKPVPPYYYQGNADSGPLYLVSFARARGCQNYGVEQRQIAI